MKPFPDEDRVTREEPHPLSAPMPPGWPVVDCANLLRGHRQVFIRLDDCLYTLRLTRGKKLILTK